MIMKTINPHFRCRRLCHARNGRNRGKRTTNQIQRNGDYTPKGRHKDEY